MKKKTSITAGLVLLFLVIYSCEQEDQIGAFKSTESENSTFKSANDPLNIVLDQEEIEEIDCDETIRRDLLAGQDIYVGEILIRKENEELVITYDLSSTDWQLKESHLFVGDMNDAPFTNSGNPKIGHFPYHGDHGLVNEHPFRIPLNELNDCFSVITHAVVVLISDGSETANETAFGLGDNTFDGNRWGWYLDICNMDCESDENETNSEDQDEETTDEIVDDEVEGNSDTNGNDTAGSGNDGIDPNGCMDAYAFDKKNQGNAICFYEDFNSWGWTNYIGFNEQHTEPLGITYRYPIFASAFQCDIENSMEVGYLQIHISGGDGIPYANIKVVLTNSDLMIEEFNFFVGESPYPLDQNGRESIDNADFDFSLSGLNTSSYNITDIPWYDVSYFISHIKVCPKR
ncbi:hypothetical protein QWY87_14040 [Lutimonas halocynthiae]|uniref:hypothetical protein n=1 Tax=Lutimonas halocynthiae TaxID=1446477 RepID=UPI0025B59195|nr:hypothetical protein [Lutimonas halocynthiae]MDN3643834.1 hypothetical protein [Lutimonas halocynthiae]